MARPPRIDYQGAWHHVMNRGAGRRQIFCESADRQYFFEILKEIRGLFNLEIHAFSLMDNHFHLLTHSPEATLSKAMRYLGAQYTQHYNKTYHLDGPLFRGRFKSLLLEKESSLEAVVRYIHLNPVKAAMVKKPEQHKWTSHKYYVNPQLTPDWLVTSDVLTLFNQRPSLARRHLHEFVLAGIQSEPLAELIDHKKPPSILGSKGFKDWIKDNFTEGVSAEKKKPLLRTKRTQLSTNQIWKLICQDYQVKKSEILATQTGNARNEPKSMFIYLLKHVRGLSNTDIASELRLSVASVTKNLQRFGLQTKEEPDLAEKATVLKTHLLSTVQS